MKINVKAELGIAKSFEVKESNKNIRKTWALQKRMAKTALDQANDDATPEQFEEMIDGVMELQDTVINYVVEILSLTDAQAEKVEDMSFDDTLALATRISSELLHIKQQPATEEDTGLEA